MIVGDDVRRIKALKKSGMRPMNLYNWEVGRLCSIVGMSLVLTTR